MDHAQLVTVNQSVENGADNFLSLFFAERLFLADVLKEFAAFKQLHHNVNVLVILLDIQHFYDVGVINLLNDFDLSLER